VFFELAMSKCQWVLINPPLKGTHEYASSRSDPESTAQGKVIRDTCSISSSECDYLDVVGSGRCAFVRVSHGFGGARVGTCFQRSTGTAYQEEIVVFRRASHIDCHRATGSDIDLEVVLVGRSANETCDLRDSVGDDVGRPGHAIALNLFVGSGSRPIIDNKGDACGNAYVACGIIGFAHQGIVSID